MAMFPIFMIGLVVGIAVSYAFYKYKQDIPSKTKIHVQENIKKKKKNDINILEQLNNKLYNKIDKLEKEIADIKLKNN